MRPAILALIAASVVAVSCGNRDDDASSNRKGNANANTNASAASNPAKFSVAEPERYTLRGELVEQAPEGQTTTATPSPNRNAASLDKQQVSGAVQNPTDSRQSGRSPAAARSIINPTEVSPDQFELDKVGGDRRWSFMLPGIGSVVYLEKSGLKYLVLYDRKQYLEVAPSDLGFDAARSLNPVVTANEFYARCEGESLGGEQVAARNAFKFRFTPRAGDPDSGRFTCSISIDQETRLPSRFEIVRPTVQGSGSHSILEARQLKLNVSATLFDVPVGMRKIKAADAKRQVQSFASGVERFIEALNPPASHAKAATSSSNANAIASRPGGSTKPAPAHKPPVQSKNPRSRNGAILSK